MKALLMYADRDFDPQQKLPWNAQTLIQDLELNTLFNAMALGDQFIFDVVKSATCTGSSNDLDSIIYRQHILMDCLRNDSVVRDMYELVLESLERERKNYWGISSKNPEAILSRSLEVLHMFVSMLKKLRTIADEHGAAFESEGFVRFFAMLRRELSDDYFVTIQQHLRQLEFRDGVLISAELGNGNKGANYVLRKPAERSHGWMERIFAERPPASTFSIADRDIDGARALAELRGRGINLVANALAQANDHILRFVSMVRTELAFYIGCSNLHAQLARIEEPVSLPLAVASCERILSFHGLYDVCLALASNHTVVGNTANADTTDLVLITGANQGGKTTFLRSIGLAQLMMQCGMFVPAESWRASLCAGLFTHYKREEDATMTRGKLEEELSRMSDIVDNLTSNAMVLLNESFAATNEREGSELARQIVRALLERGIRVFFVTHLIEFAHGYYEQRSERALFLRAQRHPGGTRSFRLAEGEPLQTSYGEDVYDKVFGHDN